MIDWYKRVLEAAFREAEDVLRVSPIWVKFSTGSTEASVLRKAVNP